MQAIQPAEKNGTQNNLVQPALFSKRYITFLKLLKQHFPKSYRLHKIFNKNTVRVSYSCMNNVSSIIHHTIRNYEDLEPPNKVATAE